MTFCHRCVGLVYKESWEKTGGVVEKRVLLNLMKVSEGIIAIHYFQFYKEPVLQTD